MSDELTGSVKLKKGKIHAGLNVELLNREWKEEAKRLKISDEGNFSEIILSIEIKSEPISLIGKAFFNSVKYFNIFTIAYVILPIVCFVTLFFRENTWIERLIGFPLCLITAFLPYNDKSSCSISFLPFDYKYIWWLYCISLVWLFIYLILFSIFYGKWQTTIEKYCPKCLRPSAREEIKKILEVGREKSSYQRRIDTPRIEHYNSRGEFTGYSREDRSETVHTTIPINDEKTYSKCRHCDHIWDVKTKRLK